MERHWSQEDSLARTEVSQFIERGRVRRSRGRASAGWAKQTSAEISQDLGGGVFPREMVWSQGGKVMVREGGVECGDEEKVHFAARDVRQFGYRCGLASERTETPSRRVGQSMRRDQLLSFLGKSSFCGSQRLHMLPGGETDSSMPSCSLM